MDIFRRISWGLAGGLASFAAALITVSCSKQSASQPAASASPSPGTTVVSQALQNMGLPDVAPPQASATPTPPMIDAASTVPAAGSGTAGLMVNFSGRGQLTFPPGVNKSAIERIVDAINKQAQAQASAAGGSGTSATPPQSSPTGQ